MNVGTTRTIFEAILILIVVVQYIRLDRLRASVGSLVVYLEANMAKALADRSPWVRIPAETLGAVLKSKVRALPTPRQFNGKAPKHPAESSPARRRKMGAAP
jgi:hypothetical protein